jgi:hypothetical protein
VASRSLAFPRHPGFIATSRLPLGKHNQYRMRRLPSLRFAIERYDAYSEAWLVIYMDDFPRRTFLEMQRLAAASEGVVVCAHCEVMLPAPTLRDAMVACHDCFMNPPVTGMPVKLAITFAISAALWVGLFFAVHGMTH